MLHHRYSSIAGCIFFVMCFLYSEFALACKPTAIAEFQFDEHSDKLSREQIWKVILLSEEILPYPIGVVALTAYFEKQKPTDLALRRNEFVKELLQNSGVPAKYIYAEIAPAYKPDLVNLVFVEAEYLPTGACPPPFYKMPKGNGDDNP